MAFLLDSLRKTLGRDDDEAGFTDLHYIVGNTSGMDVGQVPSPIDQRIGRMAQIGGSIMELQITNPATFQIDRREMLNVISQLDLDITLHGDPNIGFTAAYATRGQGVAGYNIVHRYMKRYLEQMAGFKYEIEEREDLNFSMGYVNMHASNEQIPPREERLASDVSVDPFGESTIDIFDDGEQKKVNIYRNEEFLEYLFDYFFLEVVDQPYQYYEPGGMGIFSQASEDFRNTWNRAKAEIADQEFDTGEISREEMTNAKRRSLFETAASVDRDISFEFLDRLEEKELPRAFTVTFPEINEEGMQEPIPPRTRTFNTLGDITNHLRVPGQIGFLENAGNISREIYRLNRGQVNINDPHPQIPADKYTVDEVNGFDKESVIAAINQLANELWKDDSITSTEAKTRALLNNLDLDQVKILEEAANKDYVEKKARDVFAHADWDVRSKIIDQLATGRQRDDFLMESSIFFHIMPAWMQNASNSHGEKHQGWNAPEFIWDAIVGERFENYRDFQNYLNENRENELNVIAAVGCCYLWGHFTQRQDMFSSQAFEGALENIDMPTLKEELEDGSSQGRYSWSEWMNKFGLKVNIEAMYGDPGQIRRVWRPKDIAVACHAINMTAEKQSENWAEDYKGPIAKFTIDMEHTASYGVDPYQEIQELIENERDLASQVSAIDTEKPLAEIVKTYHLTKPGWEQQQGHRHGPFARGDQTLYTWLYNMVENGFARNPDDEAVVMFEVGGEYREEMYVIRVAMDMIEEGIKPEELDPNDVPLEGEYENSRQALMARFFGLDKPVFNREWAKIEEHAFDPLKGLLQAEEFDYTWSSSAAIQNDNRPGEWQGEEYR